MYIQSSYSNSGTVSRHSYIIPYCQHYMLHIASVYQHTIKFIFLHVNSCVYQYHDIEFKTISRSNNYHDNDKYHNIVQLYSMVYTVHVELLASRIFGDSL